MSKFRKPFHQEDRRTVAQREYQNGRFGTESASLSWAPPVFGMSGRWVVSAWDHWAHNSLTEAKAHYRNIGVRK